MGPIITISRKARTVREIRDLDYPLGSARGPLSSSKNRRFREDS